MDEGPEEVGRMSRGRCTLVQGKIHVGQGKIDVGPREVGRNSKGRCA
ncbi:hypothetical protein [Paenibacillus alba]|uniref:Uncharacterized protein n=1 Tax=Paenibacillus alba TaxID=1197127 RepID=A0ABU6GAU1_9BACL|nr:hypothetical protein [Paenibacillus alba]MEC0230382.1 hypothetical protein [Paenibacillus alba]